MSLPRDMDQERLQQWARGEFCVGANDTENARRISELATEVLALQAKTDELEEVCERWSIEHEQD